MDEAQWLKQSQSNSLQGHMKCFSSYLGIEQSSSGRKATGHSKNGCQVTSQTNYGELEKNFPKNSSCGPAAMSYKQIKRWYTAFCVQRE